MKYTTLGRTGLVVSRLALGCMSYGDPTWRPWVLPEEEARPFFRLALEAGINLFDTADMYSLGVSEEVTGRVLAEMGRREEEREMLPLCLDEGIGVLPWSPLARGLLAGTRATPADREATPRAASDDYARQLYDHPADTDVLAATRSVAAALEAPYRPHAVRGFAGPAPAAR